MPKKLIYLLTSLLILCVALYFITQTSSNTIQNDQSNFAVKDTSSISKIFIADTDGKTTLLYKQDGIWYLDEKGENRARKDAVEYILKILPTLSIKAPISERSRPAMIKRLATKHRKVEIYMDGNDKPSKTIFIGDATQDHYGNLALLESSKSGRSQIPYYIQSDGKRGHLLPIFFTEESDWAYTSVFEYTKENIKKVSIEYPLNSEKSFEIVQNNNNVNVLQNGKEAKNIDAFFASVYLENFEKVFYEIADYKLSPSQVDSVVSQVPFAVITVEGKNNSDKIKLIRKDFVKSTVAFEEDADKVADYDPDRCYGIYKNKLVLCQYYTFDKLLLEYQDFLKK